jgi:hypothetical protein
VTLDRVGQKNKITRRWARLAKGSVRRSRMEWQDEGRRGTRPAAPRDQRTASAYLFGAICPKHGKGAGLVLPRCNTAAMSLHLAEIGATVAPGAHAVLLVDQAGWHLSDRLVVPPNITLVSLPPKCPELNAAANVWQFMRENWLSNRVFRSYDAKVAHCCDAWNRLIAQPWTIMSIGLRDRAHRFCSKGFGINRKPTSLLGRSRARCPFTFSTCLLRGERKSGLPHRDHHDSGDLPMKSGMAWRNRLGTDHLKVDVGVDCRITASTLSTSMMSWRTRICASSNWPAISARFLIRPFRTYAFSMPAAWVNCRFRLGTSGWRMILNTGVFRSAPSRYSPIASTLLRTPRSTCSSCSGWDGACGSEPG